jgi:ABC-type multidrug transport system fused ATPase/permease subunit
LEDGRSWLSLSFWLGCITKASGCDTHDEEIWLNTSPIVAKVYGQTSRDMRRLDSVSRSPLYSIYGETIAGVPVLRAFGASSKLLRDMLSFVDTNSNPYYWMWGVNRWLSIRFNLLSAAIVGAAGLACLVTPNISASLAGFALAFASSITGDLLFMVCFDLSSFLA